MEAGKTEAELEARRSGMGRKVLGVDEDQDCEFGWSWTTTTLSV